MTCKIEGCDKAVRYSGQGVCQMHYFRHMRNGHYGLTLNRKRGPSRPRMEGGYSDNRGYVTVHADGHALADRRGIVREHRLVYFNQINSNPCECELCGKPITWKTLHIDHIDNSTNNNHASNLRALCRPCNVFRGHNKETMSKYFLEVNGVKMDAMAWARMPGVLVAGQTISRRKKNGASDYDAIYGPRRTHHGTTTKHPKTTYDALRGIVPVMHLA